MTANSLANVKTNNYHGKCFVKTIFDETLVHQVNGQNTVTDSGFAITLIGAEMTNHKQGEVQDVDKTYDLVIGGGGCFIIRGENGTYLIRNGHFPTDKEDNLTLSGIDVVMDNGGLAYMDRNGLNVRKGGIIYNDEGNELNQVQIINPDDVNILTLNENGIYSVGAGGNLTQVYPSIYRGRLERFGVGLNTEMIRTMEIQRAFQFCAKALTILDQMSQKSTFNTGRLQKDIWMNMSYYTGVPAMRVLQDELGITANNTASVSITRYKPRKSSFGDLLYTQTDTRSIDLLAGHGVRNTDMESTFVQGGFEQTGYELDFAVNGKAYPAAEANEKDEESTCTRDGSFMISATDGGSYLVTRDGYYVLELEGERIELEYGIIKDENGKEKETAELDLSNLEEQISSHSCENPDGPIPVDDNLLRSEEISGKWVSQADMDDSTVTSEILLKTLGRPMAIVSTGMINLIETQRALQLSSRVVNAADETESIINALR